MSLGGKVVEVAITWRHDWAPHLFSIRTTRPTDLDFRPGQFVRIGLPAPDGTLVWRAYSIASAPAADHLEFYSIVVPDGPFTQLLARRTVGDTIALDRTVYGFLRTDRFAGGRHLWLLATGTGIAPFVAMLDDDAVWRAYEDIVLVHGVREERDLAYRERVPAWLHKRGVAGPARLHYLPTLTGTAVDGLMQGRITTLLADGSLEAAVGLTIVASDARLMICGNPSMIKDARAWLVERGLGPVRRETPGQFIAENFW